MSSKQYKWYSKNDAKKIVNNRQLELHNNPLSNRSKTLNTEWKNNLLLMKHLGIFNYGDNILPNTWSSSEGGINPQAALIPNVMKQVIQVCTTDLDKLVEQDYESQIVEAEMIEDDILVEELQRELLDGLSPMSQYSTITITDATFRYALKKIFTHNIIWDLGFQMTHLQNHPQNSNYTNHGLCQKCFCPCSNAMKPWRLYFKINDIFCPEIYNCRSKRVSHTPSSFLQHCVDHSGSCLLYRAL